MSQTLRILIVDDSVAFRTAIKAALLGEEGIEVIGSAANGKIALSKMQDRRPDIVILDLEMPEMDGIETVRRMRQEGFTSRVILFAAPTGAGYDRVHQALELGADDFLAKPTAESGGDFGPDAAADRIKVDLVPRLRALGRAIVPKVSKAPAATAAPTASHWPRRELTYFKPEAIVIASSTGGPMALERMFAALRAPISRPVFLCQHMPPPFTANLASQLASLSGVVVREGKDGEAVKRGQAYIAPGGFHMTIAGSREAPVLRVYSGPRINFVIPAADPLFSSAAAMFGPTLMAFVLTGMGEDGKVGAIDVKHAGGGVMVQDEKTAVVWGMPGAVHEAGAADAVGSLEDCAQVFSRMAT